MRRLVSLALCLAAFTAQAQTAAPPQDLPLDRLFTEPALDGTLPQLSAWMPDGTHYALVERSGEGKDVKARLLLVDAATGASRVIADDKDMKTFGTGDAKVKPSLLGATWSPAGDAALLGGGGDLFLLTVATGDVRRLTTTPSDEQDAQFSPDGRFVAFVRDNDLWALELASGREIRLTSDGGPNRLNGAFDWLYQEELADRDTKAFAWSPDSRAIALLTLDETNVPRFPLIDYTNPRPKTHEEIYPKSGDPNPVPGLRVVPVVEGADAPAARELKWPDDSLYVVRVGWVPDGRAVWYEILDREQTRLDLVRLDTATGVSTTLLTETDPAWINLSDDLHFFRDGRFVWSSEKSGSRHLYLHDAQGRPVKQLTSGPWEVESVESFDEKTGTIWFSSNASSVLERQLWRVGLDGKPPVRVTGEPGTHTTRIAPGARFIVDHWSRANRPPSEWLLDGSGKRVRAIAANEHPPLADFRLGTIEMHTIERAGAPPLYASLLKPANFDPAKKYPVILYLYGGPHAQVVRDAWGGRYTLFHQALAAKGFLVFSVDNRGSYGRGRAWENTLLKRFGKAELEDQLAGLDWLEKQPFVDGSRVGIWGWSYGGYMTLYAMTHAPDVFKAGVAVAPVTDWRFYDSAYTERYLKLPAENPEGYKESSPIFDAAKVTGALLLIHGTGDDNVHWQNTLDFVDALYKAGRPYDLQLYPNKNHGMMPGRDSHKHLHRRIADHFARALLDAP